MNFSYLLMKIKTLKKYWHSNVVKLFRLFIARRQFIITLMIFLAVFVLGYVLLVTPRYIANIALKVETRGETVSLDEQIENTEPVIMARRIITSDVNLEKTIAKFNLTTQVKACYSSVIGSGLARLFALQRVVEVNRFELPAEIVSAQFRLVIDDDNGAQYSLYGTNGVKILSGVTGELTEQDDYRLFVSRIDAPLKAEFLLTKRSQLATIKWLKRNLSITEDSSAKGGIKLLFLGQDKQQITNVLDDLSSRYFLQNIHHNAHKMRQRLQFLQTSLPAIKAKWQLFEQRLNRFRLNYPLLDLSREAQSILKRLLSVEAQINEFDFQKQQISLHLFQQQSAHQLLLANRQTLSVKKQNLMKKIQGLPKDQRQLLRMNIAVDVNRQLYMRLLNRMQELSDEAVQNNDFIGKLQFDSLAIKSLIGIVGWIALLASLLALIIVLRDSVFYKKVKTLGELQALGLTVYACIPKSNCQDVLNNKFTNNQKKKEISLQTQLLAETYPEDLCIEALRSLRTRVYFAMMESKNNILMVLGASKNVGNSFITMNFAALLARTGMKVLLVDADIDKNFLPHYFNKNNNKGLSEFLTKKCQLKDVIRKTDIENLDLLERGRVTSRSAQLLSNPQFANFKAWVVSEYDIVLIDRPMVCMEMGGIERLAGITMMVGRYGVSREQEIATLKQRLKMQGIEIKGFIFNGVEGGTC